MQRASVGCQIGCCDGIRDVLTGRAPHNYGAGDGAGWVWVAVIGDDRPAAAHAAVKASKAALSGIQSACSPLPGQGGSGCVPWMREKNQIQKMTVHLI